MAGGERMVQAMYCCESVKSALFLSFTHTRQNCPLRIPFIRWRDSGFESLKLCAKSDQSGDHYYSTVSSSTAALHIKALNEILDSLTGDTAKQL
jgi:hypothetical protein